MPLSQVAYPYCPHRTISNGWSGGHGSAVTAYCGHCRGWRLVDVEHAERFARERPGEGSQDVLRWVATTDTGPWMLEHVATLELRRVEIADETKRLAREDKLVQKQITAVRGLLAIDVAHESHTAEGSDAG